MRDGDFVDWSLAERIATGIAGEGGGFGPFVQSGVDAACADARTLVLDYTRLRPGWSLPEPELIDRSEWTRVGMRILRELSEGLEQPLRESLGIPGPLGSVVRSLAGAAAGAEAGAAVGYGARKVLGQYDIALTGPNRDPRLLFVGPNLAAAHAELGGDPELFLRWIAIHEITHSVQFASVEWLRSHVAELITRLIAGASERLDAGSLRRLAGRLLRTDPRDAMRTVLRGDLARLLVGPDQVSILDRLQVAMSVIEGHAEHVMDAAAEHEDPGYLLLRERLEDRRSRRGGVGEVIARLLGIELKLRQYRLGKAFCDQVVREAGIEVLNEIWHGPEALPTTAELSQPELWLSRIVALESV